MPLQACFPPNTSHPALMLTLHTGLTLLLMLAMQESSVASMVQLHSMALSFSHAATSPTCMRYRAQGYK